MFVVKATFGAETRWLTRTGQWRAARTLAWELTTESAAKHAARVAPLQGWAVDVVSAGEEPSPAFASEVPS